MAENNYGNPARMRGENIWGNVAVPDIEHEDRLAASDAQEIWNEIYRLFRATGEEGQREVKLAVYSYYAVNGASRRTLHARDINTGGGASVLASDVGNQIGTHRLRKFLRADVNEAYSALKESGALESDEVFVTKSMEKGVPRGYMHCAVDYLRGCPLLTEEEKVYADKHFNYSIQRARVARGNLTVDEEDSMYRDRRLSNQRESSRVPVASTGDEF